MEIFRAPRVTLIARPQFLEPEHLTVQWRGEASDGERLAEYAAGFGYSQLSQRYVDESHAAFVMPPAILGDAQLEAEWEREVSDAQAAYVRAVEALLERHAWVNDKVHRRKVAREAARSVLPNATEVKIVVS